MADNVDSDALRVVAYAAAAVAAFVAGRREQRSMVNGRTDRWPTYWYLSAALLLVMAIARGVDIDEIVSGFGRRRARSEGWYDIRREYQAIAVGAVASVWGVSVIAAIWRVPERRRRYLPAAIALLTLVCFAAVRLVSFHDVDTLLYRREVVGVRIVTITELSLLAAAVGTMFWFPFDRRPTGDPSPPPSGGGERCRVGSAHGHQTNRSARSLRRGPRVQQLRHAHRR